MKPLYTLIILALLTLTGFGQEPTLPAKREITDTAGRKIAGEIVSKTDTAIKFLRESDGKEFEIALDKLSDADRTFIAAATPAPAEKPLALVLINEVDKNYEDAKVLLENSGFEVTIGVCPRRNNPNDQTFKVVSGRQKTILVENLNAIDPYDILWIPTFGWNHTRKEEELCKNIQGWYGVVLDPNYFELTDHHLKTDGKIVVVNCKNGWNKKRFVTDEGEFRKSNDRVSFKYENYVTQSDNIVFFNTQYPKGPSKKEIYEMVINSVKELLE